MFKFNPLDPKPQTALSVVLGKVEWELINPPKETNLLFVTNQYNEYHIIYTFYLNATTGDLYRLSHREPYASLEGTWFSVKRA